MVLLLFVLPFSVGKYLHLLKPTRVVSAPIAFSFEASASPHSQATFNPKSYKTLEQ